MVYSLLDSVGPIAVVPIGAVVYAAGALGLGLVSRADLRLVRSALFGSPVSEPTA